MSKWKVRCNVHLMFSYLFYILTLQDRLTVNRETYPSITLALSKIYKNDGIGGLYAGLSPTLIGMLPYSTCYYFMYDTMKNSYCQTKQKKSLNRPEMLIIGALAGKSLKCCWLFLVISFKLNAI